MGMVVERTLLADPSKQISLNIEAERDPNEDNEQTWPTEEELRQAQDEQRQIKKKVPKGTSEYQAAWILSDEEEQDDDDEDERIDDRDDDEDGEQGEQQSTKQHGDEEDEEEEEEEEEMEELVINKNQYDEHLDMEEEEQTCVRRSMEREKIFHCLSLSLSPPG